MKKKILLLLFIIIISVVPNSFAQYDNVVCIDPGHGGPGGGKYGCNGDGQGCSGPNGLTEEWVNLQVGLKLRDEILFWYGGIPVVLMTREHDTTYVDLDMRAEKANFVNGERPWDPDDGVDDFISIHHNGLGPDSQGVMTFWCDQMLTDSGWFRGYDYLLAYKTYLRLTDVFTWPPYTPKRCRETCYRVLRLTTMPSVLSEATNIGTAAEESLFADEYSGHADTEAVAIYEGWLSHMLHGGVAVIRNAYSRGNISGIEGVVGVGDDFWDIDTAVSPDERCWLVGETHLLQAITPQSIHGYSYTFHHWCHLSLTGEQLEMSYDSDWYIMIPPDLDDYHRYVAYFSGGPYSAQVDTPNGGQNWRAGEQRTIAWTVSPGADSTTYVNVFLDRNGGNDGYPERIVDSIPGAYYWGWTWTVTPPYSTHCRIKVVAYDRAGNSAWDVSNYDFIISESGNNHPVVDSHIECKYPGEDCGDCVEYGEEITVEIAAHDPDGDSMYYEWYCQWGHLPNGQQSMTTPRNFVTYTAPTKGKGEETVPLEDFVSVYVTDVPGGQGCATGYVELFDPGDSCVCGDANKDGEVGAPDVVYLISYLFRGGPPPEDPIERADANNDCEVGPGDVPYLISYLFRDGPPPECCWFSPSQGKEILSISRTD